MSNVVIGMGMGPASPIENLQAHHSYTAELICASGADIAWVNSGAKVLEPGVFDDVQRVTVRDGQTIVLSRGPQRVDAIRAIASAFPGGHGVPALNDRSVINMTYDKGVFYDLFKEFVTPSFVVNNDIDLANAFDELQSDLVVMKPVKGHGGLGVETGSRSDILAKYQAMTEPGPMVVQKFLANTINLPGVVGLRPEDQALLDTPNSLKELRFFIINGLSIPIGKVAQDLSRPGAGQYAYLNPESIDPKVLDVSNRLVAKLRQESGVSEIFGATDLYFDPQTGETLAMEFNPRDPRLPMRSEDFGLATYTRQNMIDQLLRMAGAAA